MQVLRKKKSKKQILATAMPVIRANVAGIDLGSRSHWVAGPVCKGEPANVQEFGTTTSRLNELADWLEEQDVESVAMESTSVYWIPIYELLESRGIEVLLVNARHLGNVPGRKTDVLDCQWIQLLHSCGLLRGSFRPDEAICVLRTLKRQCAGLVEERTKYIQWMQKALTQMNVQVHHAVTDITGHTGLSIIRSIVEGERDPQKLALHRDKRCKKSIDEIAEHLTGNWRKEHLFNLETSLRLYDQIQEMIESYEAKMIEEMTHLYPDERREEQVPSHPNPVKEKNIQRRGDKKMREALWRLTGKDLCRIDGISAQSALIMVTEVGFDLSAFDTEKKFVSWLRLSPRHGISGGKPLKKKKGGTGATRVATVLRLSAMALKNSKTALGAYFRRISRHKGFNVAMFATARKLATLIYRMLRYGADYVDTGEQAYEKQFLERRLSGLKASAKSMGYEIKPLKETG